MSDEPVPILNFFLKPFRLWQAHGLNCAIYPNPMGSAFNGYVQLPPDNPDRVIAEAYNVVDSERRADTIAAGVNSGHDIIDVETHWGLTYGPDAQGWVGFDTMHAGDSWDEEIIREHLKPLDEELYLRGQEIRLILGRLAHPPLLWDRHWTIERLVAEVENLAQQLAERSTVEQRKPMTTCED